MHAQGTATPRDGLVITSGYGLKIHVHAGHLVVHDGVGTRRHIRRFNRATGGLRRLVVLGHDGYITLDALHWLKQTGAAFIQLDHHGQLVALSTVPGPDIAKLRRAQAGAPTAGVGFDIARTLLTDKLDGQAGLADQLPGHARTEIDHARAAIDQAATVDELIAAESAAAASYWKAWAAVPMPFTTKQADRVPAHWLPFGQRHSQLTRSTRLATNPANAILNYLYALLEAETTVALQTIGLDPGMGIFHTDKPGRASMALDVMEACRPPVNAYLLAMLTHQKLNPRDFIETPRGACRLRPALAKQLAETTTVWESHVSPIAERVAQLLAHSANQPLPSRLTQGERTAAWSTQRAARKPKPARLPANCRECGALLADRRHRYCPTCRDERWGAASHAGRAVAAGVLEQLRADGRDPAHGGQAAKRRGTKNAAHQVAVRTWVREHGDEHDPEVFVKEIAPRLRHVPVSALAAATGLSVHYCSLIRLGKRVPHPRQWRALGAVQ